MNIQATLVAKTVEAVAALYEQNIEAKDVVINLTNKEFDGELTIVTFPFSRFSKKSPPDTAAEIGTQLQSTVPEIESFNVVKGFLNLVIADRYWIQCLKDNLSNEAFGIHPSNGKTVMVEYSSPNTNKPQHLGHIRNNLLGYSVAEILKANGWKVIKANLINDRGIHICKSMLAWQKFGNGETPASSGKKGDHLVGDYYVQFDKAYKAEINDLVEQGMSPDEAAKEAPLIKEAQIMLQKWEANDPEIRQLWETMNGWVYDGFNATYQRLGVDFDNMYYESDTYLLGKDIIEEGLEKGVFFEKEDGSVWADLTADGLDQKLVLRGDGTAVYMTQDLGTADLKYQQTNYDLSIYVVGSEQNYHFKVLKLILQKLKKPFADGIYHLSYGMVELPHGRMKSREGTVVDADDLMEEVVKTAIELTKELGKVHDFTTQQFEELAEMIGIGALKFHLLKIDPTKKMLFNPEESISLQGHTATFIQYSYARIQSLKRNWEEAFEAPYDESYAQLNELEKELLVLLWQYPNVVQEAGQDFSPALVANHAYEIAKVYNKFYAAHQIMKAETKAASFFRYQLSVFSGRVIKQATALLGIDVPDQM